MARTLIKNLPVENMSDGMEYNITSSILNNIRCLDIYTYSGNVTKGVYNNIAVWAQGGGEIFNYWEIKTNRAFVWVYLDRNANIESDLLSLENKYSLFFSKRLSGILRRYTITKDSIGLQLYLPFMSLNLNSGTDIFEKNEFMIINVDNSLKILENCIVTSISEKENSATYGAFNTRYNYKIDRSIQLAQKKFNSEHFFGSITNSAFKFIDLNYNVPYADKLLAREDSVLNMSLMAVNDIGLNDNLYQESYGTGKTCFILDIKNEGFQTFGNSMTIQLNADLI